MGPCALGGVRRPPARVRPPYASPGHARITLPGPEGGYGRAVDGLEGFARTFLLAGFRLAGERGADPHGYAEWYAQGLAAGSDPHAPDRWLRLSEHAQAKVEAASLALVLDLTREWVWDGLSPLVQEQLVDYLAEAVGDDTYPRINWVWFRLVVQSFLRSVGGPHSLDEMTEDLATHDTFVRADAWLADGDERSYDHYNGWALHLYPTLWARMRGAQDLAAPRRERDVQLLDRFLDDALALVGADGSPLLQGRSLTYRFAAAAPFWVGAIADVPSHSLGLLRRAASGVVDHFVRHGAPTTAACSPRAGTTSGRRSRSRTPVPGRPTGRARACSGSRCRPTTPSGQHRGAAAGRARRRAARRGSPGLARERDARRRRRARRQPRHRPRPRGRPRRRLPLYARLAYSTATAPWSDPASRVSPVDQSVTLVDARGRATHRTGWRVLGTRVESRADQEPVGVSGSVARAHWLDADTDGRDHGSGLPGTATDAGTLTVVSLVRGPWEVRLVRVDELADGVDAAALHLRVGGWPVVPGDGLVAELAVLGEGTAATGRERRTGASPLGEESAVDVVDLPVEPGRWRAVLLTLAGPPRDTYPRYRAARCRHPSSRRQAELSSCTGRTANAPSPTCPDPPERPRPGDRSRAGPGPTSGRRTRRRARDEAHHPDRDRRHRRDRPDPDGLRRGTGGGEETTADGPVTLTLAGWSLDSTPEFQTLADAYHEANPEVTVEVVEYPAGNDYATAMTADLAAGTAPDVYVLKNLKDFVTYSNGQQLLDVSDVVGELDPATGGLDQYEAEDGKSYAVPYRQDSWVLYYDKDLFAQAGVAEPDGSWTWEDYGTAAQDITEALSADGVKGTYLHNWQSTVQGFALAQGEDADLLSGDYAYLAPFYERALALQDAGAQADFGTITTNTLTYQGEFGLQKAAMLPMGTWYTATLIAQQASGEANDFEWGIAPIPQADASTTGTDSTPVTFGDPTGLGINPKTDEAKIGAAKDFLRFAAGEEGANALAEIGITPALTNDTVTETFFALRGRARRRPVEVRVLDARHAPREPGGGPDGHRPEHPQRPPLGRDVRLDRRRRRDRGGREAGPERGRPQLTPTVVARPTGRATTADHPESTTGVPSWRPTPSKSASSSPRPAHRPAPPAGQPAEVAQHPDRLELHPAELRRVHDPDARPRAGPVLHVVHELERVRRGGLDRVRQLHAPRPGRQLPQGVAQHALLRRGAHPAHPGCGARARPAAQPQDARGRVLPHGRVLPYITSIVAIAVVWNMLFSPEFGPINQFLTALGVDDPPGWTTSATWSMPAVIIVGTWREMGYYMLLLLAGLQTVPAELHEAARMDGASAWQRFLNVTLPCLRPTMFFVTVMLTIGSFKVFDLILVMTNGGPGQSTLVLSQYIWQKGFVENQFGYASAVSVSLFLICIAVTLFQFFWNKKKEA